MVKNNDNENSEISGGNKRKRTRSVTKNIRNGVNPKQKKNIIK